jgi:hypothetical protein
MKRIIFTLLLSATLPALYATSKEYKREITKEFEVGSAPSLHISNKFGNIRIIEGTENKIMFKIEITGNGETETVARQNAESVTVDFSRQGDRISAETVLKSINCSSCGRTIHYVVVAPASVTMNLENKYGNIHLDNAVKPLKVDLKYGNIQANSLTSAVIDLKYGAATIQTCEALKIDNMYSKLNIGKVQTLVVDSKYDDIRIGTVTNFRLSTAYSHVKIDRLEESLVAENFNYCTLDIPEVATTFSKIKIDAAYTQIKIALNKTHNYNADLHVKYGHIKKDGTTLSADFLSTSGNPSETAATVEISASYGNIVFD